MRKVLQVSDGAGNWRFWLNIYINNILTQTLLLLTKHPSICPSPVWQEKIFYFMET